MNSLNSFFTNNILIWGKSNLRMFPWRKTITPYKVLISELLLQRTTFKQVEGVFEIFIEKFPTPAELAKSELKEILEVIQPLGLLRRANVLSKVAKQIEIEFSGNIPDSYEELIKLFGIGKYIANAILCFSYNKRAPIVDTNVIRIFQRFFKFKSEKKYIESDKKIWEFAEITLPERNYQMYNYALLDFGNIVCNSKNPNCDICLLNAKCSYYSKNQNYK